MEHGDGMDHSGMDHGGMNHGHAGHDMPMPMPGGQCSVSLVYFRLSDSANEQMNMLWNNDIKDVCVVFSTWHIRGPLTMAISWYVHLLPIDER